MTVLSQLAQHVAEDPFDLNTHAMAALRDTVVDAIGCIHLGANDPSLQKGYRAVDALGEQGDTRILGTALTCSKPRAAMLMATAGHIFEYDDWEVPGNTHPSVVLIPALLASLPRDTSGTDFARAYLAGFEVIARIGEAINYDHYDMGWHATATLGALGAAAAVGRVIGLDADQMCHAISLAVSRCSGWTAQFGTEAKPYQVGFAAEAGVICAHLAANGVEGQPHMLEHPKGLANLMGPGANRGVHGIPNRLGNAFTEHSIVLKPWPSCGYTHRIMTAALSMGPRINRPIARIDLHLPDFHFAILPFHQPADRSQALFSLPYVTAMGLLKGRFNLADLESESWRDAGIQQMISKTHCHPFAPKRPDLNYDPDEPDRIEITYEDGVRATETCAYPLGSPQNRMSAEQVRQKFRENMPKLSDDTVDQVFGWPDAPDMARVIAQL